MKTIGVIGLGIIGSVWAKHYAKAGVLAGTWNRTPQSDFEKWLPTPEAVVRAADVVQIVVADPPAVRSVIDRIVPVLSSEKIVVQSSTIDPESSEQFRQLVMSRGARYLEAPFTGSKPAAEEKKTVYYFGGDAALIAELEPLLSLVSETRFHIGTNRQAATLKLAMNLNIAAHMQGLAEALTMARRAGLNDDLFFTALAKNVSYSGVTRLKEPKLRAGDFSPQFSVKHLLKDLKLAAHTVGGDEFPLLDTLQGCYHAAAINGLADEDISAVIKQIAS
jgi:3-hydroxyisobutyrate dehydrogenase-like beta-hydroxyacid dehydrogenase